VLAPEYPIETHRLLLRPFIADDVDDAHAYLRLEEVTRYLYWQPRDRAAAAEAVAVKAAQTVIAEPGERLTLAVVWRQTGRVAGEVNLMYLSRENAQGEIGYVLNPAYQGRGVATEAAAAMLRLGFDGLRLHRVVARCDARNVASTRVMRRLGMRCEAHFVHDEVFKGEWGDTFVYAMLDYEWRARVGGGSGYGAGAAAGVSAVVQAARSVAGGAACDGAPNGSPK